jgi:uncharacterized FAD-dependent dehydrogenase
MNQRLRFLFICFTVLLILAACQGDQSTEITPTAVSTPNTETIKIDEPDPAPGETAELPDFLAWASALVTSFGPAEFGSGAFAGVEFQRELEARFFAAGGGDYTAPAQSAADFLSGELGVSTRHSTYTFGTRPARLDRLLPELARDCLARGLLEFERQIPGFSGQAGEFVGLESRSSGPLRMPRERASRRASGWLNLYPIGEGAGWAGGIMSAMLDGANSALALLDHGLAR